MIRHINDMLDVSFGEYSRRFPAFFFTDENGHKTKPVIVPAQAIANDRNCPMYFKRLIDVGSMAGDPYYILFKADPLRGDASREKAVEFFDDFLYEKLRSCSSLDRAAAARGIYPTEQYPQNCTMSREEAVNAEVLPAADDRGYREFYDEQLAVAQAAERDREEDEFERKNGFRRDDPSIIDVDATGGVERGTAVQKTQTYEVGRPQMIWYGVDMHIPSTGTRLGYNRGDNRLSGRRRPGGYIREAEGKTKSQILAKLISMTKKGSGLWNALKDIEKKFDLNEVDKYGAGRGYFVEFKTSDAEGNIKDGQWFADYGNGPGRVRETYSSKAEAVAAAKKFSAKYTKEYAADMAGATEIEIDDMGTFVSAIVRHGDEWDNDVVAFFCGGRELPQQAIRLNAANVQECGKAKKRGLNEGYTNEEYEYAARRAKENLQEWYPNATEDQIQNAMGEAMGNHNRILDALERHDQDAGVIWADIASGYMEGIQECDRCGDDTCKAGEKCGHNPAKRLADEFPSVADADEIARMMAASGNIVDEEDDEEDGEEQFDESTVAAWNVLGRSL